MSAVLVRVILVALSVFSAGAQSARTSTGGKRVEWPSGIPKPDLVGFWKTDCRDDFGVKIEPADGAFYSLSFCGPGGCFAPGTWQPNSPIFGDKRYGVLSSEAIQLPFGDGFRTYHRCASQAAEAVGAGGVPVAELRDEEAPGVHYKPYYEGLPDVDKDQPFASQTTEQANALRLMIRHERGSTTPCARVLSHVPGTLEVCGQSLVKVRQILKAMAHGLPTGRFSRLWLVDLRGDGQRGLVGQYDVKLKGQDDRYAAFFAFQWNGSKYRVTAATWFLEGTLHAVRSFGPTDAPKVFLRFLSCTECHAWVYLAVIDFTVPPTGVGYEFGYDPQDPESQQPEIEYELPGKGHSIDATVETRIPIQPSFAGPHLLQHFAVEGGEDEWWLFSCKGLRCTPEMFEGTPPEQFINLWKTAITL